MSGTRRYVVAVAGPSGSGKSALVQRLVAVLGDACALHMREYDEMAPALLADLRALKDGQSVVAPAGTRIAARKYIIFETPFGRAHATGALIDLLIWLDVPLEIPLAWKLRDLVAEALRDERPHAARERLAGLDAYLAHYLALGRRQRVLQAEQARSQADVILEGSGALEPLVERAREQVLRCLA